MAFVAPLATVAFVAGLASFFSPCIVPVVPGYVAFLARGSAGASAWRRLGVVLCFVLGFGVAFVILGAAVGALGNSPQLQSSRHIAEMVGGALIIVFGLAMTTLLEVPFLMRDVRYHGPVTDKLGPAAGAALLGAAFGVGWTPCVGPVLLSILLLAGTSGGIGSGAALLAVYALGLGIPFLVVGLAADRSAALMRRFSRATQVIEIGGGVLLIVVGIAVFTGSVPRIVSHVPFLRPL